MVSYQKLLYTSVSYFHVKLKKKFATNTVRVVRNEFFQKFPEMTSLLTQNYFIFQNFGIQSKYEIDAILLILRLTPLDKSINARSNI